MTLVQELGQPSLTVKIDRARIARYGLNVADINSLIETAIGGDVATQVVEGEKQFDLVVRLKRQYRVGGLLTRLPISIYLMPVLYAWWRGQTTDWRSDAAR